MGMLSISQYELSAYHVLLADESMQIGMSRKGSRIRCGTCEEYQHFLRSLGYAPVAKAAFGKAV